MVRIMILRVLVLLLGAYHAQLAFCDEIPIYRTRLWRDRRAVSMIVDTTSLQYNEFRQRIFMLFTMDADKLGQHQLLSVQNDLWDDPPWYITLTLLGKDQDRTTLLIRSDNLYLIGFNNSDNVWFAFMGYQHLIPNSIELSIEADYASLLGLKKGGKWRLPELALGRKFYWNSVRGLSDHPNSIYSMGIAAAKIVIMTIEAVRINPIGDRVSQSWSTDAAGHLSLKEAQLTVLWGEMSFLLLCLSDGFPWSGDTVNHLATLDIKTKADVEATINIVLYVKRYDPDNPERCIQFTTPGK